MRRGGAWFAHRVGRPDQDGRRPGFAGRCVSPGRRPPSGNPQLRPLRQGTRVPGRLSERLAAHGGGTSRCALRLEQQIPELGSRRSRKVGAGGLRLRARRFARRGPRSGVTGALVCGDETLSDRELQKNRCELGDEILAHPLDDEYHRARSPRWDRVTVPFLSAANWGGQGLHPRGNFEGFVRAASKAKWLEADGIEHWTHFYTDYGRELQLRFFDHFLKGKGD